MTSQVPAAARLRVLICRLDAGNLAQGYRSKLVFDALRELRAVEAEAAASRARAERIRSLATQLHWGGEAYRRTLGEIATLAALELDSPADSPTGARCAGAGGVA